MAMLKSSLIFELVDRATGPLGRLGAALGRFQATNQRLAMGMIPGGNLRTLVGAVAGYQAMSGAIQGTVGAAMSFESAFSNVKKVVEGTPEQLGRFNREIVAMSKRLPVTVEELSQMAAIGGQAGLSLGELGAFTELAAKASVAFEMSAQDTGDALAKIQTQLQLTVRETGGLADVINHLANTTASSERDILEYMKRVAAQGEMFGFTSNETAAVGAAMISAGAEADVAATSFRNVGLALAKGPGAKPSKRTTMLKQIGLDAKAVQKNFNSDSMETLFDVLKRIRDLPKEEQASALSDIFGEEARALAPLVNRLEILETAIRRAKEEAASGAVEREFAARAERSADALQILRNNIRAVGIEIGNNALPAIAEFATRFAKDIGSLSSTADNVFGRIAAAWGGLKEGLGFGGADIFAGLKQQFTNFESFIFGTQIPEHLDGMLLETRLAKGGSRVSEITQQFREMGAAIRGLVSGDLSKLGELSSSLGGLIDSVGALGTFGGAVALTALAGGMRLVAAASLALATSPIGRLFAIAFAISSMVSAARGASSLGEFASALSNLSTLELGVLAFGLWAIGSNIFRIGRAAAGVGGKIKEIFGGGKTPVPPAGEAPKGGGGRGKALFGLGAGAAALGAYLFSGGRADAAEAPVPRARPSVPPTGQASTAVGRAVSDIRGEDVKPWSPESGETVLEYNVKNLPRMFTGALFDALAAVGPGKLGAVAATLAYGAEADKAGWLGRRHTPEEEAAADARAERLRQLSAEVLEAGPGPVRPPAAPGVEAPPAPSPVDDAALANMERAIQLAHELAAAQEAAMKTQGGSMAVLAPTADEAAQISALSSQLEAMTAELPAAARSAMDALRDALSSGADGAAAEAAARLREAITGAMSGGQAAITLAGSAMGDALVDAGARGGQGLQSGVETGVAGATAAASGAAAAISGAFAGLGPVLFAAGSAAGAQLAAGLQSQVAAVQAAARSLSSAASSAAAGAGGGLSRELARSRETNLQDRPLR